MAARHSMLNFEALNSKFPKRRFCTEDVRRFDGFVCEKSRTAKVVLIRGAPVLDNSDWNSCAEFRKAINERVMWISRRPGSDSPREKGHFNSTTVLDMYSAEERAYMVESFHQTNSVATAIRLQLPMCMNVKEFNFWCCVLELYWNYKI